jgi:hypothetical protein
MRRQIGCHCGVDSNAQMFAEVRKMFSKRGMLSRMF